MTFPFQYRNPIQPGYTDLSRRQGFFFNGETVQVAIGRALTKYPTEIIDVQNKRTGDYLGRYMLRCPGNAGKQYFKLPPTPVSVKEHLIALYHQR